MHRSNTKSNDAIDGSSTAEEDPYAEIDINSEAPGTPIEGYVEYNYEVGRRGRGPGQFGGWIQHYAVTSDGKTLFTCDSWNNRIQSLDLMSRKPIHAFPSNMAGFKFQPRGIGIFRNGNLCINCVGFDGTSQIGIFTADGQVSSRFGAGVIGSSCAMTIDSMDRIIVMDKRKMRVIILTKEGKVINSFDPLIDGDILRMTCDSRNRIIVSDHLNDAVQVYDSNGKPMTRIHPAAGTGHNFKYPGGVACDALDNILVCDVGNHRVTQFNTEGVYRATVLTKRHHGLFRPHDIVATPQGNLLINETEGTFIKVFCYSARRY